MPQTFFLVGGGGQRSPRATVMRVPATPSGCNFPFLAIPVVSLADSLYHRLQILYPFGI